MCKHMDSLNYYVCYVLFSYVRYIHQQVKNQRDESTKSRREKKHRRLKQINKRMNE